MNQEMELAFKESRQNLQSNDAKRWFQKLIQTDQCVGELYSINYETAKVQIHDRHRRDVGGIPSLSFLIATRINPDSNDPIDFKAEDDNSTIYIRTDARNFTRTTTLEVLQKCFPTHKVEVKAKPFKNRTQTELFGDTSKKPGEVDIILRN